jgi:hypothetical protein
MQSNLVSSLSHHSNMRATSSLETSVEFHDVRISCAAATLFAVTMTREGAHPYTCEQLTDVTHSSFFVLTHYTCSLGAPDGGLAPKQAGGKTVSRNITLILILTLTVSSSVGDIKNVVMGPVGL